MLLRLCALLAAMVMLAPLPAVAQQGAPRGEQRLALVIGNGAYPGQHLPNAPNDARAVAQSLRKLEFTVIERVDAGKKTMEDAVLEFGEKLRAGGIGLFYYAGHGLQVRGRNYLVPIDASLPSEASVRVQAVDVDLVLEQLNEAQNRANVVILDACRNNPFLAKLRGAPSGLAAIDAARGTLIAYSTAPGKVAVDGDGRHSPYTAALVKTLDEPGLKAEEVFKRVRAKVVDVTKGVQTPWESSSLTGDLIINLNVTVTTAPPAANAAPGRDLADIAFWTSIQSSTDSRDYRDYLTQFPGGVFSSLARRRLDDLQRKELAAAEADRKRVAAAEAEKQRVAALEAERQRKAAEETERKRQAAEAEKQRLAALESERQRKAVEEAERKRLAAEEAERRRQAAEAESQRLATLEAERQRKEAEAERERQEKLAAEHARAASAEAERQRQEAEQASVRRQQAALPPPATAPGSVRGKEWSSCEMRTPPFISSSAADGLAGLWFGYWMTSVGGDSRTRWETLRCRFLAIGRNSAQVQVYSAGTPPFSSQESVSVARSGNEIAFTLSGRTAKCLYRDDGDELDCTYGGRAGTSHRTTLRRVVSAEYLPDHGDAAKMGRGTDVKEDEPAGKGGSPPPARAAAPQRRRLRPGRQMPKGVVGMVSGRSRTPPGTSG